MHMATVKFKPGCSFDNLAPHARTASLESQEMRNAIETNPAERFLEEN